MKKSNIYTLVMLACMTFGFALTARAQFYSSEQVYCYQYEKTVNDGISSKLNKTMFYFVNFQKDMMGFVTEYNLQQLKKHLLENPEYYSERAIMNLANSYNSYKNGPGQETPTMGPAQGSLTLYKYCDDFSTSSKYTYRRMRSYATTTGGLDPWGYPCQMCGNTIWGKLNWESLCYSFSRDRLELIIWSTSDPENRDYYKLVDVNTLKPNTDFLD